MRDFISIGASRNWEITRSISRQYGAPTLTLTFGKNFNKMVLKAKSKRI
jgi:hypothetical protein